MADFSFSITSKPQLKYSVCVCLCVCIIWCVFVKWCTVTCCMWKGALAVTWCVWKCALSPGETGSQQWPGLRSDALQVVCILIGIASFVTVGVRTLVARGPQVNFLAQQPVAECYIIVQWHQHARPAKPDKLMDWLWPLLSAECQLFGAGADQQPVWVEIT